MAGIPKITVNPLAGNVAVGGKPIAVKATAPVSSTWTAKADPIVGAGPAGTGTHRTKSGRLVNDFGIYVSGLPNAKVQKQIESGPINATTGLPNPSKPVSRVKIPQSASGSFQLLTPKQAAQAALPPTTDKTKTTVAPSTANPNSTAPTPEVPVPATSGATLPPLPGDATYQPVATPNLDPYSGQTTAQAVAALLNPQYKQVTSNSTAEQNALKGFAASIIAQLQGQPQQVANDYTQAQNVTNGLASTAAAQLAAANPNSSVQSLLQSIGAPQAQQDQVSTQLNNAFNGGAAVLNDTQGANAGSALAAQKAAALTFTTGLAGVQGLAATNAEHNLLYQEAQQKAAIAATEPTLANQIASAKATALYNQAQFTAGQRSAVSSNALAKAGYEQNNVALGVKVAGQNFTEAVTLQKLTDAETKQAQSYGLSVARIKATNARYSALGKASQSKLLTAANKQAEDFYFGVQPKQQYNSSTGTFTAVPGTGQPPVLYGTALKRLVAQGVPAGNALTLLNTYYQPGEGGRPDTTTPVSLNAALKTATK